MHGDLQLIPLGTFKVLCLVGPAEDISGFKAKINLEAQPTPSPELTMQVGQCKNSKKKKV